MYELPNHSLYTFTGVMTLDGVPKFSVGPQNVLLRGCLLRSCKFVFGLVVFTGADTKIMKNQRPTPSKQVRCCYRCSYRNIPYHKTFTISNNRERIAGAAVVV